jgi:NAD(P)-dependent dehydrogenase (short-subunit alcohol dehydrogenase family)
MDVAKGFVDPGEEVLEYNNADSGGSSSADTGQTQTLRFDGEVALVTGGASGIGRAICTLLAERGPSVIVNGNFRASGSGPEEEVVADIRAGGGKAVAVNGSVADDDSVRRMVAKAVETFGRLGILVNSAGVIEEPMRIQDAPGPKLDRTLDVNLRGTMMAVRAAWPHLVASGSGRILNFGSSGSFGFGGPWGWDSTYSVVKSALFAVTRQMGGGGAEFGIKANMIMPWANSPMVARSLDGTELGKYMEQKLTTTKAAIAALYLLHKECPVTGQFISAAGGRVARVFFASSKGYYNRDLTPEDVRDNWSEIYGNVDENDRIYDAIEITSLIGELREVQRTLD